MDRKALRVALCLGVLLAGTAVNAAAGTIMVMSLSGIGSDISINSFSFGLTGNYVHSGGGWHVQAPSASDFTITRNVDSFSPQLLLACADGTIIPSGDVEFFLSTYSTTLPYLDYHFTDALISSVQLLGGGGGGGLPEETVTITFEHVTVQYAAHPTNPWGAVLPLSSQVQEGPFALNFAFDVAFDAAQFGNSDIVMDATIPGQRPVPEPGSMALLGSGIMGLAGLVRRKRVS